MSNSLNWVIPSIIGLVGSSIFSVTLCCNENEYILSDNYRETIYLLYIYLFVGIFAAIFLISIYLLNYKNKEFLKVSNMFNKKIAMGAALLLIIYQSALLISINLGGPVSMVVVNLNLALITGLLYLFYKKPVNNIMITGILFMIISGAIVVYGKNKFNK
jgi:hypothetical protein